MSKNSVSRVGEQLVYAREEGIVPWSWVVDETRSVERVECWPDFEDHFDDLCRSHRRDPWEDQPERIVVVSEKGTVRGTLLPVLDDLRVKFFVCHGFASATAAHDLATESAKHDRPTKIIYVGDFDPSGLHIPQSATAAISKSYASLSQRKTFFAVTSRNFRRPTNSRILDIDGLHKTMVIAALNSMRCRLRNCGHESELRSLRISTVVNGRTR